MTSKPFNEDEQRFLLAEILKNSKVSIEKLLGIIKSEQIEPNWNELWLPTARNVKACGAAFQELLTGTPAASHSAGPFEPVLKTSLKRRLSAEEPSLSIPRPSNPSLLPKPSANGAQLGATRPIAETTSKKRGRPTKEVLDARRAEAATRGTLYPPLKAAGRKSMGETPGAQIGFGSEGPASEPGPKTGGTTDTPTTKKRRGRPPKEEIEARRVFSAVAPSAEAAHNAPPESMDLSNQAADVSEVVERAPEPAPPAGPSGAAPQDSSKTIQPQPLGQPPSG